MLLIAYAIIVNTLTSARRHKQAGHLATYLAEGAATPARGATSRRLWPKQFFPWPLSPSSHPFDLAYRWAGPSLPTSLLSSGGVGFCQDGGNTNGVFEFELVVGRGRRWRDCWLVGPVRRSRVGPADL